MKIHDTIRFSLALMILQIFVQLAGGQGFVATRMNNKQPIITRQMFLDLGATADEARNINGPSLIRIPDWIPPEERIDSSAVYYLYFANHRGDYLRLAWSSELEGPWHLYKVGSDFTPGNRGVLDLGADDKMSIGNSITLSKHLASPDVHIDDSNKQIHMYFHSPVVEIDGQRTFVASSVDGLSFQDNVLPVIIGTSYARVFQYKDSTYAVLSKGGFAKGGSIEDPWQIPEDHNYTTKLWDHRQDNPFEDYYEVMGFDGRVRHPGIHLSGDTLSIFYSRVGDSPERIMLSSMILDEGSMGEWEPALPHMEILRTEEVWEGIELPNLPSESGSEHEMMHQLRDPDIFEDIDGSLYLIYSGAGENALGLAKLERSSWNPVHNSPLKAAPNTPELHVLGNHSEDQLLFRINMEGNTDYEIRIYSLDGRLAEVFKGKSLPDGTSRTEWNPQNHARGIYIAKLLTRNSSVSVKFHL